MGEVTPVSTDQKQKGSLQSVDKYRKTGRASGKGTTQTDGRPQETGKPSVGVY